MAVVARTAADYAQQLAALLPSGPAWEQEFQPVLHNLLHALAPEFARLDMRALQVLNESFLTTFHETLADWERVLGLPDECSGAGGTVGERKALVRSRLLDLGGQTPAFYMQLAIRAGYPNAWVQELRTPRFGSASFGRSRFGTWAAQHMWILHAGGRLPGGLRFGVGVWGERFGGAPGNALVCLIRRAAPAHTLEFVNFEEGVEDGLSS